MSQLQSNMARKKKLWGVLTLVFKPGQIPTPVITWVHQGLQGEQQGGIAWSGAGGRQGADSSVNI